MMSRVLFVGVGLLFGLGTPAILHAVPGDPVGTEFRVNTHTTGRQSDPAVAPDGAGGFVVVWESDATEDDPSGNGIRGQRFDAAGTPAGGEFQVNSYTTGNQSLASVLADGSQGFVVVWVSDGSSGTDTSSGSIQARRFDADSQPTGGDFQVNTFTTDFQCCPSAAALADGFVVVWQSIGSGGTDASGTSIQAQRFNAAGAQVGGEFQVNSYTSGFQLDAGVATIDGGFVVVWDSMGSSGTDTSGRSVQGQRFDAQGMPAGNQFQVNAYTNADQAFPGVVADGAGGFVAQWQSGGSFGTDTSGYSLQMRRFDGQGVPQGGDFQVNTYTTGNQFGYTAGPDGTGGFVVLWESQGSPGTDTINDSIQGRRFTADWQPLGLQFQVNTETTEGQNFPGVALDGAGGFVVVWRSGDSTLDIKAQRFEGTTTPTSTSSTTSTQSPETTTTTVVPVVPGEALDGRKLDMTTKPGHADKSKLRLLAKGVTLGDGNGSADDPVVHGGALTLSSSAGGFTATHPLVGSWKYVGKVGQGKGYKWKSTTSPIRSVAIKGGRLAIAGQGAALGFDLDDDPNPVRLVLTIGAHAYCLDFGGDRKFKANRLYRARQAVAPATCP